MPIKMSNDEAWLKALKALSLLLRIVFLGSPPTGTEAISRTPMLTMMRPPFR